MPGSQTQTSHTLTNPSKKNIEILRHHQRTKGHNGSSGELQKVEERLSFPHFFCQSQKKVLTSWKKNTKTNGCSLKKGGALSKGRVPLPIFQGTC